MKNRPKSPDPRFCGDDGKRFGAAIAHEVLKVSLAPAGSYAPRILSVGFASFLLSFQHRNREWISLEETMFPTNRETESRPAVILRGTGFVRRFFAKPEQRRQTRSVKTLNKLMTLYLGAALLFGIFVVSGANAEQIARQDFGGGGIFSYDPPQGWTAANFPGLKFKISRGAPVNGVAPNIVVVDEEYSKSLDDYAKDNAAAIQKMFGGQNLKMVEQTDFMTSDGARAIKGVIERDDDLTKKRLRQAFYFYDAGDQKLVATCTGVAEAASTQDLVCDASMKTFSVKPNEK
jgi:hypothetical protein